MKNSISIKQLNSVLNAHFKGIDRKGNKVPLLLVGGAGLGKTTIVKDFAEKMGIKCFEYRAAYSEAGDFKGLAQPQDGKTIFLRPEDLPSETDENAILFFDEINRAPQGVMNCILQASDGSGRIATHKLPKGLLVVAAMNPDDGNYSVTSVDNATKSRFGIYHVDYERDAVLEFAKDTGWHKNVISFLACTQNIFAGCNKISDEMENVPTPRNLERLSSLEHAGLMADALTHKLVTSSLIGVEVGNQYHAFVYEKKFVSFEELLTEKKAWDKIKGYADPKAYRSDLLSATCDDIAETLQANKKLDKDQYKTVVKFCKSIGADTAMGLVKRLVLLDQSLLKGFTEDLTDYLGVALERKPN